MTVRVYLAAATFLDEPGRHDDLPAERVFVNAADVAEIWVETESAAVGEIGKHVSFSLARPMEIGFQRVEGTIERKLQK